MKMTMNKSSTHFLNKCQVLFHELGVTHKAHHISSPIQGIKRTLSVAKQMPINMDTPTQIPKIVNAEEREAKQEVQNKHTKIRGTKSHQSNWCVEAAAKGALAWPILSWAQDSKPSTHTQVGSKAKSGMRTGILALLLLLLFCTTLYDISGLHSHMALLVYTGSCVVEHIGIPLVVLLENLFYFWWATLGHLTMKYSNLWLFILPCYITTDSLLFRPRNCALLERIWTHHVKQLDMYSHIHQILITKLVISIVVTCVD